MCLMAIPQCSFDVIDSPTFEDSNPIHVIKEYAWWCKGLDQSGWILTCGTGNKLVYGIKCCIVMHKAGIVLGSTLGTSVGFKVKLGV